MSTFGNIVTGNVQDEQLKLRDFKDLETVLTANFWPVDCKN